jgi:hypothetical protein
MTFTMHSVSAGMILLDTDCLTITWEDRMTLRQLEERLCAVERELAALKDALSNGNKPKDWRWMLDFAKEHPGLHEVFEEAMKLREKDRAAAYKRFDRSRRAKP